MHPSTHSLFRQPYSVFRISAIPNDCSTDTSTDITTANISTVTVNISMTSSILLLSLCAYWTLRSGVYGSIPDPPPFQIVQGLDDQHVVDNVLFNLTARSKRHCAVLCSSTACCDAFTHTVESSSPVSSSVCRCYNAVPSLGTSSTAVALGARTYYRDPCLNHKVLAADKRDYYNGQSRVCDNLDLRWYRFQFLNGNNAVMAAFNSVSYYKCSTDIPLVLRLQGQSLPPVGQQIDSRACGPDGGWCTAVTVRRCSEGFYIYKTKQTIFCAAFCTQPQ
ncbi:uncharacterized protein [Littorina saxatilis]|uniref:Uncharacterized protein n=1 Tax=Littorina saxatilis TaxID=31220 RepID=A0AAN9BGZ3_9CAEN